MPPRHKQSLDFSRMTLEELNAVPERVINKLSVPELKKFWKRQEQLKETDSENLKRQRLLQQREERQRQLAEELERSERELDELWGFPGKDTKASLMDEEVDMRSREALAPGRYRSLEPVRITRDDPDPLEQLELEEGMDPEESTLLRRLPPRPPALPRHKIRLRKTAAATPVRVYLADLEAYNAGKLIGQWIDLPTDREVLDEAYDKLSHGGKHDTAIHDYKAPFRIDESEDIYALNDLLIELEYNNLPLELLGYLVNQIGYDLGSITPATFENFIVSDESPEDYVYEFYNQTYRLDSIPEEIRNNIDWDGIVYDWKMNGTLDYVEGIGTIHILR